MRPTWRTMEAVRGTVRMKNAKDLVSSIHGVSLLILAAVQGRAH